MNIKSLVIDDIDYDCFADCYYLKNENKIVGGAYCGDDGFIVKTDDNEVREHFKAIVQVYKNRAFVTVAKNPMKLQLSCGTA